CLFSLIFSRCAVTRNLIFFPTRRSSDLRRKCRSSKSIERQYSHSYLKSTLTQALISVIFWQIILHLAMFCAVDAFVFNLAVHHRSEEHTSELQSRFDLVCRLLLEKNKIA